MANGEMLEALKLLMEASDEQPPQNVTNVMVLAAVRETYRLVGDVMSAVGSLSTRVGTLEQAVATDRAVQKETEKDKVTSSGLWNNYGRDIVKLLIVAAITWFLARAGATP